MANNVGRYCEVIGHTIKGRVWKVIARPDQVTNIY